MRRPKLIRLARHKRSRVGFDKRVLRLDMTAGREHYDTRYMAPSLSFQLHDGTCPAPHQSRARSGLLEFDYGTRYGPHDQHVTKVETPTVMAYTKRGAVPHLTRDNVARLPTEMLHLSLEHM